MSVDEGDSDHGSVLEDMEELGEGEAELAEEDPDVDQPGAENDEAAGSKGAYNAKDVNDQIFEELRLRADVAEEVQTTWNSFMRSSESREAAGEAIYGALFDAAPSLQSLFKTPRAVMAMRFMNGVAQIISNLRDPKALKITVETLGFQHLDLEVTVPRVVIFRDAIVDLLSVEMGAMFTKKARDGFCTFLNYVGGAYIYIRFNFADRLKILASSWATANKTDADDAEKEEGGAAEEGKGKEEEDAAQELGKQTEAAAEKRSAKKKQTSMWGKFNSSNSKDKARQGEGAGSKDAAGDDTNSFRNTTVPTTYNDMFMFNAAVMGFAESFWMNEVLASFDTIVRNVSNSYRLQEECDVLSLRIAKYKKAINLVEYKAVMLASLRSLVPKDWNSAHEVAWSWLWENVERMIKALIGKPVMQEKALGKLWASLDTDSQSFLRREVYAKFFMLAPAGQDYFKQSTTRLHFIADRIVQMTLEIYKDPKKMVEDISALGLRHVGYGIPTDLFGPFVSACVQVVRSMTEDDLTVEAFRWSLSLIGRILTRVINEGSTIVMKAINLNSAKQLKKAVGCAPRGKRALWMLNIQVGTQSISPLLWAIETGSLESARAIITDLLTIRADRDRYYYGMDIMFERHPDIVKRLCTEAPALLPTLLDGLVWRSRTTDGGMRRVNYYVKHLLVDAEGAFSETIEWITENGDPKLVVHPVVAMVMDTVWNRIAFRTFLQGKFWLVLTLSIFIVGTAGLKHLSGGENSSAERIAIMACRCFIYVCSMGQWLYFHAKHLVKDIRSRDFVRINRVAIPAYLVSLQDAASFTLTIFLILMLATEPILHCWPHHEEDFPGSGLFTEVCPQKEDVKFVYSIFSALAIFMYFFLVVDLSVFFTKLSAFVLVCFRMLSEVFLFLFALVFFVLMFACAISALDQDNAHFAGIPTASLTLLEITFAMYDSANYRELHDDPVLMVAIVLYVVVSIIFLANLLIAQLNCAYQTTYQDMVGYARLNRGKILIEAMALVSKQRWYRFISKLHLDERVEFGEGDVGLSGGIQVLEPSNVNITTVDMIRRFGGSTSTTAQWPEEDNGGDEEDRFERIEKLIEKAMKRMSSKKKKGGSGVNESSAGYTGSNESGGMGSEHDSEQ